MFALRFADVYKEPGSPSEYKPAFYPMSSSCGQLGQSYEDYDCEDACPKNSAMEITGSTNAKWIGAPPPLFCGPRSKYDELGYVSNLLGPISFLILIISFFVFIC